MAIKMQDGSERGLQRRLGFSGWSSKTGPWPDKGGDRGGVGEEGGGDLGRSRVGADMHRLHSECMQCHCLANSMRAFFVSVFWLGFSFSNVLFIWFLLLFMFLSVFLYGCDCQQFQIVLII